MSQSGDTTIRPPDDDGPVVAPLIAGYKLDRALASGGQGVVYEAVQISTKRLVAIKLLNTPLDALARKRFQREIEIAAALRHPNIVTIFDSGVSVDGRPYFAMDLVRGENLSTHVRSRMLNPRETLTIFQKVCVAIEQAHARGVVHRDLKPSNILVDATGEPRILDFGLAKSLAAPVETMISSGGDVVGTLAFMSPEQAWGRTVEVSPRSDVYSLGVILYVLLTGVFPYPVTAGVAEVMRHIAETTPLSPNSHVQSRSRSRSTERSARFMTPLGRDIETIVLRALAKAPQRRYGSAGELADDIGRYLSGEPIAARRDSLPYVAQTRLQQWSRRNAAIAAGVIVLAAALLGDRLAALVHLSPLHAAFVEIARPPLASSAAGAAFEHTRVIAIDSASEPFYEEFRRAQGFAEADPTTRVRCLRRLHGRLLERLALTPPRVVVIDLLFEAPGPAPQIDLDLRRGAERLEAAGTPVIFAIADMACDPRDRPRIIEPLQDWPRLAGVSAICHPGGPWRAILLARRGLEDAAPGLAMAAMAAAQQPGMTPEFRIDEAARVAEIVYWRSAPSGGGRGERSDLALRAGLSHIEAAPAVGIAGVQPGDLLAQLLTSMPTDDELAAATVSYAMVFDDAALPTLALAGKAVLLGETRPEQDVHGYPGGRRIPGVYAHAVATELLLREQAPARAASLTASTWVAVLGAIWGYIVGRGCSTQWALRWAGYAVTLTLLALLALAAARLLLVIWSPAAAVFATIVASELSAVKRRAEIHS